jgi:outer membrane lipoprotein carrier protein
MDFVKYSLRLRRAIDRLVVACLAGLLVSELAWAQSETSVAESIGPLELVEQFVSDVADLAANFEQNVYDVDGALLELSSGQFRLLRPSRFAWYYETPDEIEIVADGESLWTYDVLLEQITVAPLSDLATSPAMVLSGEGSVSENFLVSDAGSADGKRWVELHPLEDDGEFESIRIAFVDGTPSILELVDGLSQLTRIEFRDITVNSGLKVRDFEFDPPRGVDVIGRDD